MGGLLAVHGWLSVVFGSLISAKEDED